MTHNLWQTINQWQASAIIQCTINSCRNSIVRTRPLKKYFLDFSPFNPELFVKAGLDIMKTDINWFIWESTLFAEISSNSTRCSLTSDVETSGVIQTIVLFFNSLKTLPLGIQFLNYKWIFSYIIYCLNSKVHHSVQSGPKICIQTVWNHVIKNFKEKAEVPKIQWRAYHMQHMSPLDFQSFTGPKTILPHSCSGKKVFVVIIS